MTGDALRSQAGTAGSPWKPHPRLSSVPTVCKVLCRAVPIHHKIPMPPSLHFAEKGRPRNSGCTSPAHEAQQRQTQGSTASLPMAATPVTPATSASLPSHFPPVSSSLCMNVYMLRLVASRLFLFLLFFFMIPLNSYQNNKQTNCPIKSPVDCHVMAPRTSGPSGSVAGSRFLQPRPLSPGVARPRSPVPNPSRLPALPRANQRAGLPLPGGTVPSLLSNGWMDKDGFPLIFLGDLGALIKPSWACGQSQHLRPRLHVVPET